MTVVVLSEVEEFAGSNDNGPWLKYTLKDVNGQAIGVTFSAELGNVAKSHVGDYIDVDLKPNANPKYAPTVTAIKAAESNGDKPGPPSHRAVVGGDKDRAIARMACLKAAVTLVAPRAATAAHPDYDAPLEAMNAAQRFETWVYRDIDDSPFT